MRAKPTLLTLLVLVCALAGRFSLALELGVHAVSGNNLNVRLSPSPSGQISRRLGSGDTVTVLQVAGEWARISEFYDGAKHGNKGMVAEWVAAQFLKPKAGDPVAARLPVPKVSPKPKFKKSTSVRDSALQAIVIGSVDYAAYGPMFMETAERLIRAGTCTLGDFRATQGWSRDAGVQPPTYFTYCSPEGRRKSVFLDPLTGTVFH
jgi:hypothetical protein